MTLDVAEHVSIGRIDNRRERSLGVYDRAAAGEPVAAIGGNSSYGVKPLRLLLHWSRNARETEGAAAALWDAVAHAAHLDLPGGGHIQLSRPVIPAPAPVGSDRSGVYEYIIDLDIYYRRN